MNSEDSEIKIKTCHRMKLVIKSISEDRVRKELLPFIEDLIDRDEEEVLHALAEEVEKCWNLLKNKTLFLPILEKFG